MYYGTVCELVSGCVHNLIRSVHPQLHYKYNRNLVGEEDQEIQEHLNRRHLKARRMTRLASSTRLPSRTQFSYNADLSHPKTGEELLRILLLIVILYEFHILRREKTRMRAIVKKKTVQEQFHSMPTQSPQVGYKP